MQPAAAIQHLKVHGKGGKVRYLPLHPVAARRIHQYLESSGHHLADRKVPLFIPLRGKLTGAGITANGIYTVVTAYAKKAGIEVDGLGVHGLMGNRSHQRPGARSRYRQGPGLAGTCQYQYDQDL